MYYEAIQIYFCVLRTKTPSTSGPEEGKKIIIILVIFFGRVKNMIKLVVDIFLLFFAALTLSKKV